MAKRKVLPSTRNRRLRWLVLVALALGSAAILVRLLQSSPQTLYEQSLSIWQHDPAQAEDWLYRAIDRSSGDYPPAQLLLCRVLGRQDRWLEARAAWSMLGSTHAYEPHSLLQFSREALEAEEWELAELTLNAARRHESQRIAALRELIQLHMRLGNLDLALADCQELSGIAPGEPLLWRVAGEIHQLRQQPLRAVEAFCRALQVSTDAADIAEIRFQLVEGLLQLEDAESARHEFDLLRTQLGEVAVIELKHVRLLRLEGRAEDALQRIDKIVARDNTAIPARMLRGILHLDQNHFVAAVADLEYVVQQQPANKEAHYKLATAYQRLNRTEDAQRHLELSQRLNRWAEQILVLEGRVRDEPDNHQLIQQLAEIYDHTSRHEEAAVLRRALPK